MYTLVVRPCDGIFLRSSMAVDVFHRLRIKLALSITLVLALVLAVLIGSFNMYLDTSNRKLADKFIEELVVNEGKRMRPSGGPKGNLPEMGTPPDRKPDEEASPQQMQGNAQRDLTPPPKPSGNFLPNGEQMPNDRFHEEEPPEPEPQSNGIFPLRNSYMGFRNFYTAKLAEDGSITEVVNNFSDQFDSDQLDTLVSTVFKLKRNHGTYQVFGYEVAKKDYGYLIVLLDRAIELRQEQQFAIVSLILFIVNLFVTFALAWAFALWSVRPVQEAFLKQKRFIADASHELKTPIAVIGANIDVLQQDIPDNKWLDYIKAENMRMSQLVKDLLYLAKNDAGREKLLMLPFDLADAAACAVLPFESVAFEQGKTLEVNMPKDPVPVVADEAKIKQVVIILTDNALKNSDKGAVIRITAGSEGSSKRFVKVYNSGEGISDEDMQKIFDRFYRVDTSRNRNTGGYGLGLAIAQTIAQAHGGKITVSSKLGEYAEFTLHLPAGRMKKLTPSAPSSPFSHK